MKVELNESDYSSSIMLTPETLEEVALLFRLVKHSKREVPHIHLSFSKYATNGIPYCSFRFNKKESGNQVNSISNRK